MTDQTGGMTLESNGFSPASRIMRARVLLSQSAGQLAGGTAPFGARTEFYLEMGSDEAEIRVLGESDRVPFDAATLQALSDRIGDQGLDLVLTDASGIDLTFDVPPGLLPEVRRMIDAEIAYRSPFAEGAAMAIWEAFETDAGSWTVKAALTLQAPVEKLRAELQDVGLHFNSVIYDVGDISLRTLPPWVDGEEKSPSPFALFGGFTPTLKAAVVGAGIFALSSTAHWAQSVLTDWSLTSDADIAQVELRNSAAASSRLRGLDNSLAMSTEVLALTGEMSKVLPDNVFLDQIIVDGNEVTLVGFAPSAAEVTRLLADVPTLSDIKFASPVIRDNTQSIERFRIAGILVPGSV